MPSNDIVEHSFNLIRHLPRISQKNLQNFWDARKKKKSRRGDYGGRYGGHGKRHRKTYFAVGREAYKDTFVMRFPREEYYKEYKYKREYPPLSLKQLQMMIDLGRLDVSKPIDLVALLRTGLLQLRPDYKQYGFNLTDEGADIFIAKVNIEVQWASESSIAAIEKNGGVISTAFYDIRSLDAMLNTRKFFESGQAIPRRLPPPDDAVIYYTSPQNRGYLANAEEISKERLVTAQKFGYELPKIEADPDYDMLIERKDPRQIFYGLQPGWVVNLRERMILKSLDPTHESFFRS